ncbi:uncharacterized protein LOC110454211 [Mizuhopecten yessoensis]|uniref:uncharacterized protein LOC110454211 n=1 Tax=Mizuhopecten yessoensis TaxID=6573 RepID=UPI000B45A8F1|nr:uncharacterized protein LOC110454211 [Mizuhopecten yessoensis]
MAMEPDELTVIVVSAKGLQGKKPGRHKFSVIFGVGSKKYRTSVVKHPEPEWNEESVIQVNNILDQVFFIVTEKEDVLGQVNIPVTSLQGPPGHNLKSTLQPNKKCSNPKGELVYQCYVSKRRPAGMNYESKSPTLSHKYKKDRRGSTLSSLNKKFSRSIHDLLSFGKSSNEEESGPKLKSKQGPKFMSISAGLDNSGKLPVVLSVSPNVGLTSGGTRITIVGKNLGFSKSDIVDLTICESDCVDYIEYESSTKIHCKTRSTLPGKGDIILETESGGIGTLRNAFAFVDKLPENGVNPFDSPNPFDDEENSGEQASFTIGDGNQSPEMQTKAISVPVPSHKGNSSHSKSSMSPPTKKHFMKHLRRASEGHVLQQLKGGPVAANPPASPTPNKFEKLQLQVLELKKDNLALKQDNKDMKAYIDKLVAKVIQHCPDALESDQMQNRWK